MSYGADDRFRWLDQKVNNVAKLCHHSESQIGVTGREFACWIHLWATFDFGKCAVTLVPKLVAKPQPTAIEPLGRLSKFHQGGKQSSKFH